MSELIETLRDACNHAIDAFGGDENKFTKRYWEALSLLSDRSALLWALLEEEAERVVLAVSGDGLEHRVRWHKWHRPILVDEDGDLHLDGLLAEPSRKEAILFCAGVRVAAEVGQEKARAIQEQRKREAGVSNG